MVRAPMADRLIAASAGRRGARRDSGREPGGDRRRHRALSAFEFPATTVLNGSRPGRAGPLSIWRSFVVYGTLAFQTPIVEIPLDEVTQLEAQAYRAWRDGYQRNWRGTFDPIALRLAVRPAGRMAADLTVMPLIASSEYRPFISLVADAKLGPYAGDLHPESLVHAIMAMDIKSQLVQQGARHDSGRVAPAPEVALGWIGGSIDVYLDDDPLWAELARAKDPGEFFTKHGMQLPLGVHIPVTDPAKLALFLNAVRVYADQTAPNLVVWQNREHHG